jgi:inward rectifier potassium channel
LKLERERSPVFALSFTAMHRIDAASPLYGMTRETLEAINAELVITVTGLDEVMAQPVHARISYRPEDIMFGHRYVDIFGRTPDGRSALDFRRFDLTEEMQG